MKYLGLLCMAAAAVAGGFLLAGEWEMRVKMLGIFRQMAVYLKARILYSNETLPEALKEIGSRFSTGIPGWRRRQDSFFYGWKSGWRKKLGSRLPRYGRKRWKNSRTTFL